MFWIILCWKCQTQSSLIENLLNIKTYAVIFGMQISHLYYMQFHSNGQNVAGCRVWDYIECNACRLKWNYYEINLSLNEIIYVLITRIQFNISFYWNMTV
jgi:hypothetical protein